MLQEKLDPDRPKGNRNKCTRKECEESRWLYIVLSPNQIDEKMRRWRSKCFLDNIVPQNNPIIFLAEAEWQDIGIESQSELVGVRLHFSAKRGKNYVSLEGRLTWHKDNVVHGNRYYSFTRQWWEAMMAMMAIIMVIGAIWDEMRWEIGNVWRRTAYRLSYLPVHRQPTTIHPFTLLLSASSIATRFWDEDEDEDECRVHGINN